MRNTVLCAWLLAAVTPLRSDGIGQGSTNYIAASHETKKSSLGPPEIAKALDMQRQGRFAEALHLLSTGKARVKNEGSTRDLISIERAMGNLLLLQSKYAPAAEHLLTSLSLANGIQDTLGVAKAEINLSSLYLQIHDLVATRLYAADASRDFTKAKDVSNSINALVNKCSADIELREFQSSNVCVQKLKTLINGQAPQIQATAYENIGVSFVFSKEYQKAVAPLESALSLWTAIEDHQGITAVQFDFCRAYLGLGRNADAAQKFTEYLLSAKGGSPIPRYADDAVRASLLVANGQTQQGLQAYVKAIREADNWVTSAPRSDRQSSFALASLADLYGDYIELTARLAIQKGDPSLARLSLLSVVSHRARTLREQLDLSAQLQERDFPPSYFKASAALAELLPGNDWARDAKDRLRLELSQFQAEQSADDLMRSRFQKPSLGALQNMLNTHQRMMSFWVGKKQTFLWIAARNKPIRLLEIARPGLLPSLIHDFVAELKLDKTAGPAAAALSKELFSKLTDEELSADWILIADGDLMGCPFGALPDRGQLMVQRHLIRLLPTEMLLGAKRLPSNSRTFLGIGDPVYNSADGRLSASQRQREFQSTDAFVLARLPNSRLELDRCARAGSFVATQLVGVDATVARLRNQLSNHKYGVIQFSTHVVSVGDNSSAIALTLKGGVPDLLTAETVMSFRLHGALIVLDGCSSGEGKLVPMAGLMGLSRAFLIAGASAVLVTRWPIADSAISPLALVYRDIASYGDGGLLSSENLARALRSSQLELISQNTRSSEWAAYDVIGVQ